MSGSYNNDSDKPKKVTIKKSISEKDQKELINRIEKLISSGKLNTFFMKFAKSILSRLSKNQSLTPKQQAKLNEMFKEND